MTKGHTDCKPVGPVLHLIDTTGPGGAETVFIELADRMRGYGFDSVAVIRGPGWVEQQLNHRGIKPVILPAKGSFNIAFLLALIKIVRRNKVALIHSHLLGSNVYAAIVGILTGIPVIATYHGMVDINPNERFKAIKHWVMQRGIKHYVTVSKRLASNVGEKNLLDQARSSTIYNGIDISRYHESGEKRLRSELGLSGDCFLIGCVGNVRKAKAYDVLIEAAGMVIERHPEAHFVVAGHQKVDLMQKLDAQIDRLGIRAHVHFVGFCDNSAAFLSQLDLFVLSSSSEGFSISTIEAMASSLPVVVTRCGGPEEIVEHGRTGWMVEPNRADALADGVLKIMSDTEMSAKLAAAGCKHVSTTFAIERMISDYWRIYSSLME